MKRPMGLMALCLFFAPLAGAYEYALQFTPNPGYRGLVVAGYKFEGNVVAGNCSYYTMVGGTGKAGGSRSVTKTYLQTCRWDLYGNLLSVTPGAPEVPAPVSVDGKRVVFAVNASGDRTGTDLELLDRGFVSTPGPHYTWLTPQDKGVLQQMLYTLNATLMSDGDEPLNISAVAPGALYGKVSLNSTTCIGETRFGETCTIAVTYDATNIISELPMANDTLRIDLTSNAGAAYDFVQQFTIVLPRKL